MDKLKLLLVLVVFIGIIYDDGVAGQNIKEGPANPAKKAKKNTGGQPPPAPLEAGGLVLEGKAAPEDPPPAGTVEYDQSSCVVGEWTVELSLRDGVDVEVRPVQISQQPGGAVCPNVVTITTADSPASLSHPQTCFVSQWTQWAFTGNVNQQERSREVVFIDPNNPQCPTLHQFRNGPGTTVINCMVGPWSTWFFFSAFNVMVRLRVILQEPQNGGIPCPPQLEVQSGAGGGGGGCLYTRWSGWDVLSTTQCVRHRDPQDGQPGSCTDTFEFSAYPCGIGGGGGCRYTPWSGWTVLPSAQCVRYRDPENGQTATCADTVAFSAFPCGIGGCQYTAWSPYTRNRARVGCVATRTRAVLSGTSCFETSQDIQCQDCIMGQWLPWQPFTSSGTFCLQRRTRSALIVADLYGDPCTETTEEFRPCTGTGGCQYTAWSAYTRNRARPGCVATRTRAVLSGTSCFEISQDILCQDCIMGQWLPWQPFTTSGTFCLQRRTRSALIVADLYGDPCTETTEEFQPCTGTGGCQYTVWSPYTRNRARPGCVATRTRAVLSGTSCFETTQDIPCQDCIMGQWLPWQPFTTTGTFCLQRRTRSALIVADLYGDPCTETTEEFRPCTGTGGCQYTVWSPYTRNRARPGCVATRTRAVLSGTSCFETTQDIPCQDCIMGQWLPWQPFTTTGTFCLQRRTRSALIVADLYGDPCTETTEEFRPCTGTGGCQYTVWSPYTRNRARPGCVATRTRAVLSGTSCFETSQDIPCQDCIMGQWLPWQPFTSTGTYCIQSRTRSAIILAGLYGDPCTETTDEFRPCTGTGGCQYTVWSPYTRNRARPGCVATRTRAVLSGTSCFETSQDIPCQDCIMGQWLPWQSFTSTGTFCLQRRTRSAIIVADLYGDPCTETTEEFRSCTGTGGCQYTVWSPYTRNRARPGCVATRTRAVLSGTSCFETSQDIPCQDCIMGQWLPWQPFTSTGTFCLLRRTRSAVIVADLYGDPCTETTEEFRSCTGTTECRWRDWGPWEPWRSSPSCQQRRTRTSIPPCENVPDTQDRPCACDLSSADIVFLVDLSGSIDETEWAQLKQFILDVIGKFTIGDDQVRVGMVTFTHTVENQFFLNAYNTKAAVIAHVNGVLNRQGSTFTDLALRFVRENSFQQINGDRADKPNILIVLTDGFATTGHEPAAEAVLLRQAGVKIVIVGIGIGPDLSELQSMASTPSDVFAVPGFDALNSIEDKIQITTCPVCEISVADIIFVVDVSGSINAAEWAIAKQFLTDLISGLPIGQANVRIGILTFDHMINIEFHLNMHNTLAAVLARVQGLVNRQGSTYTSRALKTAREEMFIAARGDRASANDLLIILTDGASTPTFEPAAEALQLHARGVRVIAIGVGTFTDKSELEAMASGPGLVFEVDNFADLIAAEAAIMSQLCQVCETDLGDIVILLDASGSMNAAEWQAQKDFIIDLIQGFSVGPNHIQIGVATFDHFVQHEFYLNTHSTLAAVVANIATISNRNGATLTSVALEYVRTQMFSVTNGDRPNAKNILVVFSDGASTSGFEPFSEAQLLKNAGIKVVAIGVGAGTDRSELVAIASNLECVFDVTDVAALTKIRSQVQDRTCEVCGIGKADVVIMIDSSGSIDSTEWGLQKQFLLDLFQGFPIGADQIQIGLLAFDDTAVIARHLNDNTGGLAAFLAAIQGLIRRDGATFTSAALRKIRLEMFIAARGDRLDVENLLIILTDGDSTPGYEPDTEIALIKAAGIKVIVIGVGPGVDTTELTLMATSAQYLYQVTDFGALATIKDQVQIQTCDEGPSGCLTSAVDIVFVLDASSSVLDGDWAKSRQFVVDLVQDFNIGTNNIQIAFVTFSSTINTEFQLNTYPSQGAIVGHVNRVANREGSTWTMEALNRVRTESFTLANGDRLNVKNLVIIITDGMSTANHSPIDEATLLKNAGVTIIAIGVGSNIDEAELLAMATDASHKFVVEDSNALLNIETRVQQLACQN